MIAHDRHMGRLSAPPADDGDVTRASLLRRERIAPAGPTALPEPVVPGFSAVALLVVGVEPAVSTCDRDQADAVDGPGLATSMTPLRPFEFARLLHELSRRHQGSPPPLSPPSHPPPFGSCAPGVCTCAASPTGMSGSPLKFGPLFHV